MWRTKEKEEGEEDELNAQKMRRVELLYWPAGEPLNTVFVKLASSYNSDSTGTVVHFFPRNFWESQKNGS